MVHEIQQTEAGKKMTAAGAEALRQARVAAEHVEKIAEKVGDTEVYKQVSTSMKVVKDEIDNITDVRMYSRPEVLKKRTEGFTDTFANRTVEANEEATGITLHKESRWYAGWKKFSEENVYFNKLLDWKIRYEESDNIAVRLVRGVTERISTVFGEHCAATRMKCQKYSAKLLKVIDPSFDKAEWLRFCEKEVIPNVLEAFIRGDLEVLQDWCHERNTPVRVHHVWVMCRDMEEYNPAVAWKLLEVHMQQGQLAL
ncbi:Tim44-like domain protein [Cooperia oncophora]